jgi:myo-inositol-1(or 4)-monophosphatase
MKDIEDKNLQVLIKAAHAGGEVLRKYFGQTMDLVEKSTAADFLTKADLESEKAILEILKKEFPTYNILSEEEGNTDSNSEYTLVIDPMDGTNNFVLGIPTFVVSIALLFKGAAILGVIYQPITNQVYSAMKSKGAFLNGKEIKVNNIIDLQKLTIAFTCGYKTDLDYLGAVMGALLSSHKKRILYTWAGAYEYCLLASGKIESVITHGLELHDFAAGKLIAIEAGAKIGDLNGDPEKDYTNNKFIIGNTDKTNKYILDIIKPLQNS